MVSLETNVGSSGKTIYDQKEIQQNGKYFKSATFHLTVSIFD